MFAIVHNTRLPPFTRDRCSVLILGGTVNVHVSTISLVEQSHSETLVHPGGRNHSDSPLVAVTTVVSTPFTTVCGSPTDLTIPPRSIVSTRVYLGWKVVRSGCMESLMHHFQAAGFSKEVSVDLLLTCGWYCL